MRISSSSLRIDRVASCVVIKKVLRIDIRTTSLVCKYILIIISY